MIYITCGTCGTSQGYKNRNDGALTLPAAEERRLVARGVAEYVTRPLIGTGTAPDATPVLGPSFSVQAGEALQSVINSMYANADSPVESKNSGGAGINPSDEDPPMEGLENGCLEIPDGGAPDSPGPTKTVDIIDRHFDRESLLQLTRPQMEELAGDLGVDVSKCRNKGDIANLLLEIELVGTPAETGGEIPPELGAEAPVV